MQFEFKQDKLFAILKNPRDPNPVQICASNLLRLPINFVQDLVVATQNYSIGFRFRSSQSLIYQALRGFADFLETQDLKNLPKDFWAWQILLSEFVWWHLSRESSKATVENRVNIWQKNIRPWLEFLIMEGVLPVGLQICNLKLPEEVSSGGTAFKTSVIGENAANHVEENEVISKRSYSDKTLAGPIFWQGNEEYLDEIEGMLRERNEALKLILNNYWLKLVKDYRKGKRLMNKIPHDLFQQRKFDGDWKIKNPVAQRRNLYVTSPSAELASSWILRLMKEEMETSAQTNCISRSNLSMHEAFANNYNMINGTGVSEIRANSSLSNEQQSYYSSYQLFERLLGILNNLDMSVALAILIQEHPNFTPEAIASAELADKHGKSYLIQTDLGDERIFSVEKHRAKSRKFAVLTHRSRRVLKHLIRTTGPIRELLHRANIPQARYLFLGMLKRGGTFLLGHPTQILPSRLYNDTGLALAGLYPQLSSFGLTSGTLTFEKIRNTQGVLEWLDKGSVEACANKLGNLAQTSLDHYIPKPLIEIWNERLIRRFQNTIIALAVDDNSKDLLDFVDMASHADLNSFLAQLVHEIPAGKSPISDLIAKKFSHRFSFESQKINSQLFDQLTVQISVTSFTYLLAYREWCYTHLNPEQRDQHDEHTGLTPKHFMQIAEFLQAAALSDEISDSVREAFDVAKLKRIYSLAIDQVPSLTKKLTKASIVVSSSK